MAQITDWIQPAILAALGATVVVMAGLQFRSDIPPDWAPPIEPPSVNIHDRERRVRNDAASPYAWIEMAEDLVQLGSADKARYAVERALGNGPNVPPVWMRAANVYFQLNDPEAALRCTARILAVLGEYDGLIFSYYDRFIPEVEGILAVINAQGPALRYFEHVLATNKAKEAETVWAWLDVHSWTTDEAAKRYITFLLQRDDPFRADAIFGRKLGGQRGANTVFNGGFESDPVGCELDWRIGPSRIVEAVRDDGAPKSGRYSLRVRFPGTENVTFDGVRQLVPVRAGRYTFEADLKTDGITTNEGVRFRISDAKNAARLNVVTDGVTGTTGWHTEKANVDVPAGTNLLRIEVRRNATYKFDNKIAGVAWIDNVRLVPTH